jgi:hypothetical protein
LSALSTFGRLSLMMPTWPSVSFRMSDSSDAAGDFGLGSVIVVLIVMLAE